MRQPASANSLKVLTAGSLRCTASVQSRSCANKLITEFSRRMASVLVGSAANIRSVPSGSDNAMAWHYHIDRACVVLEFPQLGLPVGAGARGWIIDEHHLRDSRNRLLEQFERLRVVCDKRVPRHVPTGGVPSWRPSL